MKYSFPSFTNTRPGEMIVGIENPLLDITVNCDESLLSKYGLEKNSAILAGPEHLALYEEIKAFPDVFYCAGGATQNAMRSAQWIIGGASTETRVSYMGCVGNDDNMEKMRHSVETVSNVKAVYLVDESQPTGTCGVLVSDHGKNRSLVANLGAAAGPAARRGARHSRAGFGDRCADQPGQSSWLRHGRRGRAAGLRTARRGSGRGDVRPRPLQDHQ